MDASDPSTGVAVRHLSVNRVQQRKNGNELVSRNQKKCSSPLDFSKAAAARKHAKFMQLSKINDSYLKRLKHTPKGDDTGRKRIDDMLDDIVQQMLTCANQPEDKNKDSTPSSTPSSAARSLTRYPQTPITISTLEDLSDDDDSLLNVVAAPTIPTADSESQSN